MATQGIIEKNIAFFIKHQFPGIYREDGSELVQLVEDYYKFAETQTNQHVHVSRRYDDYRDIDSTLGSMVIYFQKKFLADLPLKSDVIKFIVKNILDLYRRKGTKAGIELFFAIFYEEFDVDITYPAAKMFKASNSQWSQGIYLQLYPNSGIFFSKTDKRYEYKDLISRNITGSASGAKAAVSKINFVVLNGIQTPIIYIDELRGSFTQYDELITNIGGEVITFGRVNGSLSAIAINDDLISTTENKVGDVFDVTSQYGGGGKAVVTELSNKTTGEVEYNLDSGGYGYTINNTRLLVSNQALVVDNPNQDFILYETLEDTNGNQGIVIGQDVNTIGVKIDLTVADGTFDISRPISTVDRSTNITLNPALISAVNSTSPGVLFPDGADADNNVIVSSLTNTSQAYVITDPIAPHLATVLNAADFEPPAMTGTASPVNLTTPLNTAFDIQTLTIGKIAGFDNINAGQDYTNSVFARAQDSVFRNFERRDQILRFTEPGIAGNFTVGEIVSDPLDAGLEGEVLSTDTEFGSITVRPFDYYGFNNTNNIARGNGDQYPVVGVGIDYTARVYGDNALVDSDTEFREGRIKTVGIENSGLGYVHGELASLEDSTGKIYAQGILAANTQGVTSGFWADTSGHINGYIEKGTTISTEILPDSNFSVALDVVIGGGDPAGSVAGLTSAFETWVTTTASDGFAFGDINKDGTIDASDSAEYLLLSNTETAEASASTTRWNNIIGPSLRVQPWYSQMENIVYNVTDTTTVVSQDYFESGQRIQDSDFYQEYSYEIKTKLGRERYEKLLKENMHLSGAKMFGNFIYKVKTNGASKARFYRAFNDDGYGSPLDIADLQILDAGVTNFTIDTTYVTADHVKGGGYNGPATTDPAEMAISDANGSYPSTTTITVT